MARKCDLHQLRFKFTALQSHVKTERQLKKLLKKVCGRLISKDNIDYVTTELFAGTTRRTGCAFQTCSKKQADKAYKFLKSLENKEFLQVYSQRYDAVHNAQADNPDYAVLDVSS